MLARCRSLATVGRKFSTIENADPDWLRAVLDKDGKKLDDASKKVKKHFKDMSGGDIAMWKLTLPASERDSMYRAIVHYSIRVDDSMDRKLSQLPQIVYWKPPLVGWWKLNTDASIKPDGVSFGAAILRDHMGELRQNDVQWKVYQLVSTRDSLVAKLRALVQGLIWASKSGIEKIHVEMDNLSVVESLQGKRYIKNKDLSIYRQTFLLLQEFDDFVITHCYRKANEAANHLASNAAVLLTNENPRLDGQAIATLRAKPSFLKAQIADLHRQIVDIEMDQAHAGDNEVGFQDRPSA